MIHEKYIVHVSGEFFHFHNKWESVVLWSLETVGYHLSRRHEVQTKCALTYATQKQAGLRPPPFTPSAGHQMFYFSPFKGVIT